MLFDTNSQTHTRVMSESPAQNKLLDISKHTYNVCHAVYCHKARLIYLCKKKCALSWFTI